MKKLTELEIQEIYRFTQKHYVEWYDVQTELVDHLANGIEHQWETNSNRTFNDALLTEFKKFGIFGFQDLVEQKTKALNKLYRKEVWFCFKDFFKLPKIIVTLFSVWLLYSFMHYLEDKTNLLEAIVIVTLIAHVFHLLKFKISTNKRIKETGRKWLFENSIGQLGGLIFFLNIGIWYQPLLGSDRQWTSTSELIVSVCIVLYLFIFYISVMIVPKKLKAKMLKENPDYNLI